MKALMFFLLLLLVACQTKDETPAEEAPPIPVLAAHPTIRDVPVYVEAIGLLHASVLADVRPRVGGSIAEVLVAEGEWVHAGDPLLRVDSSVYEIKWHESLAKLEMDKAVLRAAEKKLSRFKSLADKDLISQAEWDELETAAQKAAAVVDVDQAQCRAAKLDLDDCTLRSCVSGRVGRIDAHPGMLVSSSQATPLTRVVKLDPLFVEFSLTEKEVGLLPSTRKRIELLSLDSGAPLAEGEITFLDTHYDAKSGMIVIKGTVANSQMTLRPGQMVRVRVLVSTIAGANLIPQRAVKYNQNGPYIYVVTKENTVEMRPIQTGESRVAEVIVQEGVEPDDLIVTDGHMRLYPGSKVEVKE